MMSLCLMCLRKSEPHKRACARACVCVLSAHVCVSVWQSKAGRLGRCSSSSLWVGLTRRGGALFHTHAHMLTAHTMVHPLLLFSLSLYALKGKLFSLFSSSRVSVIVFSVSLRLSPSVSLSVAICLCLILCLCPITLCMSVFLCMSVQCACFPTETALALSLWMGAA